MPDSIYDAITATGLAAQFTDRSMREMRVPQALDKMIAAQIAPITTTMDALGISQASGLSGSGTRSMLGDHFIAATTLSSQLSSLGAMLDHSIFNSPVLKPGLMDVGVNQSLALQLEPVSKWLASDLGQNTLGAMTAATLVGNLTTGLLDATFPLELFQTAQAMSTMVATSRALATVSPLSIMSAQSQLTGFYMARAGELRDKFHSPTDDDDEPPLSRLQAVINGSPLANQVLSQVAAAQSLLHEGDGNADDLRRATESVEQTLSDDPDLARNVRNRLDEIEDTFGTSLEIALDLEPVFQFGRLVSRHRRTAAGLLIGFSAGVTRFLVGASAQEELSLTAWESVGTGCVIYGVIAGPPRWSAAGQSRD